jgi:transcriptional regulator with XRE-family HTH domain
MDQGPLQLHTPEGIARRIAERVRAERLRRGWKQSTLAARSGVSLPTIRRYERTGRTSWHNLLRLCHALGRLDEFADLLQPPAASSILELEARAGSSAPMRKRGVR